MLTWYSTMRPLSQRIRCSLIHADWMLRNVFAARAIPCCTASSKLFGEVELISDTFATDITNPPCSTDDGFMTRPIVDASTTNAMRSRSTRQRNNTDEFGGVVNMQAIRNGDAAQLTMRAREFLRIVEEARSS